MRQPPRTSRILYVEVPRQDVARFRFLLEGYGHLAVATVVDRFRAAIKLRCAPEAEEELRQVLPHLGARLLWDPEEPPGRGPATAPHLLRGFAAQAGDLSGGKH